MASKSCASRLWTIQRQSQSLNKISKLTGRAFTTTSTRYVEPSQPKPAVEASIQPVSAKPKITLPKFTTYTAYGVTETLYQECGSQAEYTMPKVPDDEELPKTEDGEDVGTGDSWWHTEVGLKPTFSTWSQVTMLHMYLLTARLRCFPKAEAQTWQQHLLDHFFQHAEDKMAAVHQMPAASTRNKYLKDLYIQWRGLLAAYDEGLLKGDAVLASAVWRNVFKADEDTDIRRLAQIVSFMKRSLQSLDSVRDDQLPAWQFASPSQEGNIVRLKSPMMDLPFQKYTANGEVEKK